MAEDMLAALTEFYQKAGIYSCDFHCKRFDKNLDSCREAARKVISGEEPASKRARQKLEAEKKALLRHGQFTQASSAYVGEKYESKDSCCRLLFLSLDPGSEDSSDDTWPRKFGLWDSCDDPSGRTPEGRREAVIKGLEKDGVKREWVHWYGTHYLAARILQEAAYRPASEISRGVCGVLDDTRADRTTKERKLPDVTPYFAHANVVKCSIGRLGNAQAPDQMYDNCQEYLKGELPLLRPDIIVTQGTKAAEALVRHYPPVSRFAGFCDRLQYLTLREPKDVLWVRTYHPRYGRFWTEGKTDDGVRWGEYARAAAKFMAKKREVG
jgi:hypothetical protein